tara:strand:+ start:707 stop:1018 length:312 start_codon:yes stop_codon:yes gene_type:complete
MKAPKIRGLFRNVRTQPRQFSFKTRHTSKVREDWEERKRRVEQGKPKGISFRKRRNEAKKKARITMLKILIFGTLLMYVAYKMIVWAETTDWGTVLDFIKDNG